MLQTVCLRAGKEREKAWQSSVGEEKRVLEVMRGLRSFWAESNRDCWSRTRSFRSFSCLSCSFEQVGMLVVVEVWSRGGERERRESGKWGVWVWVWV